ncbi:MAG: N-acetyltransferase [Myxococcales bacterium]|nr:N-acetyltransferase [Myxococcales bacterium]
MSSDRVTFELEHCRLRPFAEGDQSAVVRHANDWAVARWLRDRFPHPYTPADADEWVHYASTALLDSVFAIDIDGEAVGAVGLTVGTDVFRRSAEVGYWLGRAHWGRGLAPAALTAISDYALNDLAMLRLFAGVYAGNERSGRVLAKAGYTLEGVRQAAAVKAGQVLDEHIWVKLAASLPTSDAQVTPQEFAIGPGPVSDPAEPSVGPSVPPIGP